MLQAMFSPSGGDRILVGTIRAQRSVLDKDGRNLWDCVKIDPYVIEMTRAIEHVGSVTEVG